METKLGRTVKIDLSPTGYQGSTSDLEYQIGCRFCSRTCQLVTTLIAALDSQSETTRSETIGAIRNNIGFNRCRNYPVVERLLKTEADLS